MASNVAEYLGVTGEYVSLGTAGALHNLAPREDSCMSEASDLSELSQATAFGDMEEAVVELQAPVEQAAPEFKLCHVFKATAVDIPAIAGPIIVGSIEIKSVKLPESYKTYLTRNNDELKKTRIRCV